VSRLLHHRARWRFLPSRAGRGTRQTTGRRIRRAGIRPNRGGAGPLGAAKAEGGRVMHFDGDERRSGARVGIGAGGGPLRELVSIALNDRPLCEVGLEMLAKECERVAKKCRLIRVSTA